jgi:phenylacetate-CoA ligase
VPYYRRVFDEVGFRPDKLAEDPDSLRKIPPVSKAYMRDHLDEFLTSEPARRKEASTNSTSGSTGEPLVFWEDRDFQDSANGNAFRHHTWCGWEPGQPRAYLWGRFEATFKGALRAQAREFLWNRFTIYCWSLSEEKMSRLAQLIRRRKPKLLHGFPSALHFFAQCVRENRWDDVKVPAIVSAAEVLYPEQREYIEETFGCRVFNRYASHEMGGIANECEKHTDMHISTETCYVEILDGDNLPVSDGEVGNVVVTNLINYTFPFIRYRYEDMGSMSTQQCPCGRGQPMLKALEGRQTDMFKTRDGRRVLWGIDIPLRTMEGVRKYQFVQKTLDYVVLRIVKDGPLSQIQRDEIESSVRSSLGDYVQVDYEFLDEIPVESSGKYRYLVCEVD